MFLQGARGRVFAVHFCAAEAPRAHILFLPPFGEEMNRSRRHVAEAASAFAAAGWLVAVPDLFGTGDSAGEFVD